MVDACMGVQAFFLFKIKLKYDSINVMLIFGGAHERDSKNSYSSSFY